MSLSKKIAFGVAVSWFSRVIGILAKLLLVPILFKHLGKEEVGAWFLLGDSQGFLALLGFGIVPTLTRHIALAKGESGSEIDGRLNRASLERIGDLVSTGKISLRVLSVFVFVVSLISGFFLLRNIHLSTVSNNEVLLAWTFMCAGYATSIWISYLECWLLGMGYVGWNSIFATITNLLSVILSIFCVLQGGGLLALAIISVAVSLVQRFTLVGFISNRRQYFGLDKIQGKWNLRYFKELIKPALLAWLTELGAFLIARTDAYFIVAFQGVSNVAAYSATYQLFANLFLVANSFAFVSPVFVSQFWRAGDLKSVHSITFKSAKIGLLIMATGIAFLMFCGKDLIELWLGPENFVGFPVIFIFCITYLLETQHATLALSARATEFEVFTVSALTAGLLNLIFTSLLIKNFGLAGVAGGTMLAQITTNNWYQVRVSIKRLKINLVNYFREVTLLWISAFLTIILLFLVGINVLSVLQLESSMSRLGFMTLVCFAVSTLFAWNFILNQEQRFSLIRKVSYFKFK